MADNSGSLRRHAEHCRSLAVGDMSEQLRMILLTMAEQFDVQAEALDAARPNTPKP